MTTLPELNALFEKVYLQLTLREENDSADELFSAIEDYFTNAKPSREEADLCYNKLSDIMTQLTAMKTEIEKNILVATKQWTKHKKYLNALALNKKGF